MWHQCDTKCHSVAPNATMWYPKPQCDAKWHNVVPKTTVRRQMAQFLRQVSHIFVPRHALLRPNVNMWHGKCHRSALNGKHLGAIFSVSIQMAPCGTKYDYADHGSWDFSNFHSPDYSHATTIITTHGLGSGDKWSLLVFD